MEFSRGVCNRRDTVQRDVEAKVRIPDADAGKFIDYFLYAGSPE